MLAVPGAVVRRLPVPNAPGLRVVPDTTDDDRALNVAVERRERTPHERLSAPGPQFRKGA